MIHEYAYADDDEPDRSTWVTPIDLARKLGPWDLDPCSNERSHIIARKTFDLERRGQDGLRLARFVSRDTRTFINPPYTRGQVELWVDAYAHVRFCFLVRFDPSTEWFRKLISRTEIVLVLHDRINFEPPPGVVPHHKMSNPFPHACLVRDERDVTPALRNLCYVLRPDGPPNSRRLG